MSVLKLSVLAGIVAVAAGTLLLFACSGPQLLSSFDSFVGGGSGVEREARGLDYGTHGQKLDVWRPAGDAKQLRPVLIFVHGGSWQNGSRGGYSFAGKAFARQGFVTLVIDYRKLPDYRFPTYMVDLAEAVAWARQNARDYGGDPDKIVLAGHSAGAHIVMLGALDQSYMRAAGVPDDTIKGVAGLAGPYDFLPLTSGLAKQSFQPAAEKGRLADTQPINFVRADAPPIWLGHGAKDEVVELRNSESLAAALEKLGVPVELDVYDELDHMEIVMALSRAFGGKGTVLNDASSFLMRAANEPPISSAK